MALEGDAWGIFISTLVLPYSSNKQNLDPPPQLGKGSHSFVAALSPSQTSAQICLAGVPPANHPVIYS